jgi:hypothetical protein
MGSDHFRGGDEDRVADYDAWSAPWHHPFGLLPPRPEVSTTEAFDALVRLGPIDGDGDRVQVETSFVCGGLCGSGSKVVVERTGDDWEVTGSTGGGWIA